MDHNASTTFSFTNDTTKRETPGGTTELNVRDHAVFAVALMSSRVFSTAAAAERSSWDRINYTLHNMPDIRRMLAKRQLPVNARLLDDLMAAYNSEHIVLRTYLTSAAGYRRHLARGLGQRRPQGRLARFPPAALHMDHRDLHDRFLQPFFPRACGASTDIRFSMRPPPANVATTCSCFTFPGSSSPTTSMRERIQRNSPSSRATGCTSAARSVSRP